MRLREGWVTATCLALTALTFGALIGSPGLGVFGGGIAFVVAFVTWSLVTGRGRRSGPARGAVVGAITALFVTAAALPVLAVSEAWLSPVPRPLTLSLADSFRLTWAGVVMAGWITIPLGSVVGAILLSVLGARSRRLRDAGAT